MNKVYLISDMHFGHINIIKYDKLPFGSIEEMDKTIISNWNKIVSNDDKVFILGDVSFYGKDKTAEIISSLHGKKILIKGNHDAHNTQFWIDMGFCEVSSYPIIYDQFFVLSHEPPTYFNEDGCMYYIYGHVHQTEMYKTITKRSACVCASRWNFTPVELNHLVDLSKIV